MNYFDSLKKKWKRFCRKAQPVIDKTKDVFCRIWDKTSYALRYISSFRKVFLAVPVAGGAVILAIVNLFRLPPMVGFDLQANGEFSFQMVRELAVLCPIIVTGLCLLMMFISKRTLTPWLVSVMSLMLPLLILLTNTFSL